MFDSIIQLVNQKILPNLFLLISFIKMRSFVVFTISTYQHYHSGHVLIFWQYRTQMYSVLQSQKIFTMYQFWHFWSLFQVFFMQIVKILLFENCQFVRHLFTARLIDVSKWYQLLCLGYSKGSVCHLPVIDSFRLNSFSEHDMTQAGSTQAEQAIEYSKITQCFNISQFERLTLWKIQDSRNDSSS